MLTVVFFGDYVTQKIAGHNARCDESPLKMLYDYLCSLKRCIVIVIDEFRTSQVCAKCGRFLFPLKKPGHKELPLDRQDHWTLRRCECGTCTNRDNNGSRDVFARGMHEVHNWPIFEQMLRPEPA
mmetsp:Transcript_907/g.2690  ORF Transcript_907/g.2690 Transcript_907/m.2690 type:complete len:125 (-) Transcript_907:157-531(-)